MSSQNISIDPEQAAASVNLVSENQEKVVELGSAVESHGASIGPTANFKATLNTYVSDLEAAMKVIEKKLLIVREGISKTVVDLGEQDATLAAQTETFLAGVETVPVPVESTPVASGAQPGTSASKAL
jgi:hypothetical protein